MSKVVNGRVKTPAASKIPKLHTLEPPEFLLDYITQANFHHQRSSASIAEDILSVDNGDFLTHRLTLASEKGHIISAVRDNLTVATRVTETLIDVGIVPEDLYKSEHFDLEHASNLICSSYHFARAVQAGVDSEIIVADGLHPLFDTYGVFAYVPSDSSMDGLLAIVKNRNEAMQQTINNLDPSLSRRTRKFMEWIDQQLWDTFTYEIAILLPDHFLPFDQELFIKNLTPDISYSRTKIIDKELRIIPTPPNTEPVIYPPFSHSTTRIGWERVNPFFVLINASDKYERHCIRYGSGTMSPRVNALFQKATDIVDLIFLEFEPASNAVTAWLKEVHEREKKKREEEKKANNDSREGGRQTRSKSKGGRMKTESDDLEATGSGQTEVIEGGESEASGSGEFEGAVQDQRSDFDSDMDETGETPDADESLAFFDAITEELKKPGLSTQERRRLYMLQLFGGKDYQTPHIPGVPDPPSVFDHISNGDYNAYEPAD